MASRSPAILLLTPLPSFEPVTVAWDAAPCVIGSRSCCAALFLYTTADVDWAAMSPSTATASSRASRRAAVCVVLRANSSPATPAALAAAARIRLAKVSSAACRAERGSRLLLSTGTRGRSSAARRLKSPIAGVASRPGSPTGKSRAPASNAGACSSCVRGTPPLRGAAPPVLPPAAATGRCCCRWVLTSAAGAACGGDAGASAATLPPCHHACHSGPASRRQTSSSSTSAGRC